RAVPPRFCGCWCVQVLGLLAHAGASLGAARGGFYRVAENSASFGSQRPIRTVEQFPQVRNVQPPNSMTNASCSVSSSKRLYLAKLKSRRVLTRKGLLSTIYVTRTAM